MAARNLQERRATMIDKVWQWLRQSHRLQHLVGGFAVGLLLGLMAAVSAGAAMEFKDWQWGGKPEWADCLMTVMGGCVGWGLRLLVVWLIIKPFIL